MSTTKDGRQGLRRRRVIGPDERASEAVVRAVASASSVGVDELPPLAERVDPGWLNESVSGRGSPAAGLIFARAADIPTEFETRFRYAGYDVTVTDAYVVLE